MEKVSDYVQLTKVEYGDPNMSDAALGKRWGLSPSSISNARYGNMSDPVALKIAAALRIPPGEVLWAARTAREKDPTTRRYLEAWAHDVGKAMATAAARVAAVVAALGLSLTMSLSPRNALAGEVGGAGGFRP